MITFKKAGNLLDEKTDALVNTVNCLGVMGKGIALQFKQAFPENYSQYKSACDKKEVKIGKMFVVHSNNIFQPQYIINFPTKINWIHPSKVEYIETGLDDLIRVIEKNKIKSITIPPLGCGNGGLNWNEVKELMLEKLSLLNDKIEILIYEPSHSPNAKDIPISTKKPDLTPIKTALIYLIKIYKDPGYGLTKLEIQKLMYFLQETGEYLKLQYKKGNFGPYANNLNHLLESMEGHYLTGFGDRTESTNISILEINIPNILSLIQMNPKIYHNTLKVKSLIEGYETPYGLELLSTVHWLYAHENIHEINKIKTAISQWSTRKKILFNERHITKAFNTLKNNQFI